MDWGTVAQWVGAGVTFSAVVIALFREDIRAKWHKPVLDIRVSLGPPDCHRTTIQVFTPGRLLASADCYYLRVWVTNTGKARAEKVQVYVAGLSRQRADGSFARVESFLPMNLRWAHSLAPEIFADGIAPEMGKHCDFAHVVDPAAPAPLQTTLAGVPLGNVVLAFDLEVAPNTGSHLIGPGVYRATLKVAGANARPITRYVELTIRGAWYADEAQMFADGLGMRLVESAG